MVGYAKRTPGADLQIIVNRKVFATRKMLCVLVLVLNTPDKTGSRIKRQLGPGKLGNVCGISAADPGLHFYGGRNFLFFLFQ